MNSITKKLFWEFDYWNNTVNSSPNKDIDGIIYTEILDGKNYKQTIKWLLPFQMDVYIMVYNKYIYIYIYIYIIIIIIIIS